MRKVTLGLICLLACLALVLPLTAQEGFPLKGTWLGDWGATATNRNQVFVVFDWDGKTISGSINPGTDKITVKNASLNPTPIAATGTPAARGNRGAAAPAAPAAPPLAPAPAAQAPARNTLGGQSGGTVTPATTDWNVHFEGDGKDAKGADVHYVVDGKIDNIGLPTRTLSGKWVSGAVTGTFKLQRQ